MFETCYEMLQAGVNKNGFVVYYGHKISMKIFLSDIDGFAASLRALGLKKGDVVTVYLPSCPQSLVAFYACSKLGLIANIVHPKIPLKLLKENLKKVNSKVLLFYDALVKNERELLSLHQILVRCSVADYETARKVFFAAYSKTIGKRQKNIAKFAEMRRNQTYIEVLGKKDDVVCYMHSGGTSGEPKIVALTNGAFNGTAISMVEMYRPKVQKGDYNLATLPVFHAYGLCAAMHTPLYLGCNLILVPKFLPKIVKGYFLRYKITIWSVVPAMLKKMLKARCLDFKGLSSLDVIWCGGDVLDEDLVEKNDAILKKYCQRARLMRGYGLTETCGVCAVNSFFHYKKGSCGRPMPGCFAQIWDEAENPVPTGELGEVAICSPGMMRGYLDDGSKPCETAQIDDFSCGKEFENAQKIDIGDGTDSIENNAIESKAGTNSAVLDVLDEKKCRQNAETSGCIVEKNGKLWIKTGDIGYMDDDGFLFVVDRKKRTLKIAAVNVFPSQVENCVKTLPFVDEACAVGVKVDGKQFLKVFVTLKNPNSQKGNVDIADYSETASKNGERTKNKKFCRGEDGFCNPTNSEDVCARVIEVCKQNLIPYSVPQFVEILSEMPRTPLGKIDFKKLEERR